MITLLSSFGLRALLAAFIAIAGVTSMVSGVTAAPGDLVRAQVSLESPDSLPDAFSMAWTLQNIDTGVVVVDDFGVVEMPGLVIDMDVEQGIYLFTLDAGPNYLPIEYEMDFTEAWASPDDEGNLFALYGFRLEYSEVPPIPVYADVTLNFSSSQPDLGYSLPEGSTWTITLPEGGDVVVSGVFETGQLTLPVTVPLIGMEYGSYLFSINGLPVFQAYEHVHEITVSGQVIDIVLNPVPLEPVDPVDPVVPDTGGDVVEEPAQEPAAPSQPATAVTSLPSTGHGEAFSSASSSLVMASAIGAIVAAAAGAVVFRQKRA